MIYRHSWLCPHCGRTMTVFLRGDEPSETLICGCCGLKVNFTRVSRRKRMILYEE
ncbi:MAG: hypothetical protein IKX89_01770 [Firmicutes bacterium]|nr:hypothetical protein [Bacillota bacterium]